MAADPSSGIFSWVEENETSDADLLILHKKAEIGASYEFSILLHLGSDHSETVLAKAPTHPELKCVHRPQLHSVVYGALELNHESAILTMWMLSHMKT